MSSFNSIQIIAIIILTIFLEIMIHKIFKVYYLGFAAMGKELVACFVISVIVVSVISSIVSPVKSNASPAVEDNYQEQNVSDNVNDDSEELEVIDEKQNNELRDNNDDITSDEESYDETDSNDDYGEEDAENEGIIDDEYVLINSDVEYINESDIADFTKAELRLARNEIYARHGCIFKSNDLNEYFNSKTWYIPTIQVGNFDTSEFNKYELANIDTIKSLE